MADTQARLKRLLKTRDALLVAIENLAEEIAATIQEVQASERPTGPNWKSATLPKGLDKVQRHKDAEKNIV